MSKIDWSDIEQVRAYRREYYAKTKERSKASRERWLNDPKNEIAVKTSRSAAIKRYYDANTELHKANMKRYHEENREELNRKARERWHKKKAKQQEQVNEEV